MKLDTVNILTQNELQTSFQWEVVLPEVSSDTNANFVSTLIQEVSFSGYNMDELFKQRLGPAELFSAGNPSIAPVSMSILSSSDGAVLKYFNAWRNRIFDTELKYYYCKDNYALPINCLLYNRKNEQKVSFHLINAFPKTFPKHELTYATEGSFVTFKVEFSVDDIRSSV